MRVLILFIIILLTWSIEARCQTTDTTNIYLTSLKEHLAWTARNKKDLQSVYVEKNELTTGSLPGNVDGVTITYLTRSEILEKTRKGKRIFLIVIQPVKVEKESLNVAVIDFSVTSKKSNFNYANGGGSTFEFKYNCDRHLFDLANKKQSGI